MLNVIHKSMFAGAAAMALAGLASPALAQMGESPFDGAYVGATVGINNFDYHHVEGQNIEDTGVAYEGLAGYRRSMQNGLLAGVEVHISGSSAKDDVAVDIGGGETFTGATSLGRSLGFDGIFGKTFGAEQQFLGFISLGYLNQKVVACCTVNEIAGNMLNIRSAGDNENGYRIGAGFEAKVYKNLNWRAAVYYSDTGRVDQTQLMTGVTAGF